MSEIIPSGVPRGNRELWVERCFDAACIVCVAVSIAEHSVSTLKLIQSRSVRRQLGQDVTKRLVCALVLSRLDYCNVILAGLPASTLAPLQRILRVAARVVLDLKPRDHISCALRELRWLPISERVVYKLCFLVHGASLGQSPDFITDLLQPVAHPCPHCGTPVAETMSSHGRTGKTADRAFSTAAPRAWNQLPTELKRTHRHLHFAEY